MPTIKFRDECRYNPERNSLEFQASEDGRELVCEIAADALVVRSGSADEAACIAAFREYRSEFLMIAERLISVGAVTRTGRVRISRAMLES